MQGGSRTKAELVPEAVSHVPHESFSSRATEQKLFGAGSQEFVVPGWTHFPEVPADNQTARKTRKALSKQEEATLFLRFNYAKYRLGELTEKQTKRFSKRRSEEMVRWYQYALAAQASIVDANMALVMAMARHTRIPHVDFPELVSEGNMALLRAIDKFDVSRGFKFSTYACRAILQGFNRMATETGRYVQRFPTTFDLIPERSDYDVLKHRIQRDNALDDLRGILADNRAKLTDIERTILTQRFALDTGGKNKTLREINRQIGLSKERIRQIQKKALAKLKVAIEQ